MQLKGRLSATTLGDVLGLLFRERATGTLELEEVRGPVAGRRHAVHLEEGLVVQVDTCLGRTSGEIEIGAALTRQVHERLDALFTLQDAQLKFRVPRPRDRRLDPPRPLAPAEYLYGRPRAERRGASASGQEPELRSDPVRARCLRVLGLGERAQGPEVRRAFRTLAARCHPDRHPEANAIERRHMLRRFAELSQAYHTLTA